MLLAVAFAHDTSPDASTLAHKMSPLKVTELAEMPFATVKLSLQLTWPAKFELALTSREPESTALEATLKVLAERELLHVTAPISDEAPVTDNVPPDARFPITWAFWVTLRLLADTLLAQVTAPSSAEVDEAWKAPLADRAPDTTAALVTLRLLADTLLAHVTAPSSREVLDA